MSKISYIEDLMSWSNEFSFFERVKVRFSETDMFGHLNNTVPFTYFEQARIQYFTHVGFMNEWANPKHEAIPVVANLQCDFLKQVFFGETIRMFVKVNQAGTSSVDLHYMGKNEKDEIVFVGRGTMVQISSKTGKAIPWTEQEKLLLERKARL